MVLQVRALTDEEGRTLERVARARTATKRDSERAAIVWRASQGERAPAIARVLGLGEETVRHWLRRFNAEGLDGLRDRPRAGRPPTYGPEVVGEVLAAALSRPDALGQPFGSWTLDRLAVYLREEKGVAMQRSRIGNLLQQEGLDWRHEETWFGERVDPAFAEKRGRSNGSGGSHRRGA